MSGALPRESFRATEPIRDIAERLVDAGAFPSRSEFYRTAISYYLDSRSGVAGDPVRAEDLDVERVLRSPRTARVCLDADCHMAPNGSGEWVAREYAVGEPVCRFCVAVHGEVERE